MNSSNEKLDLVYKFVNSNSSKAYLFSRPEIWVCTYSPHSDYFAWSDRNGVVNVINFKEFNLNKSITLQQQRQQPQNEQSNRYLVEDVNGLNTYINCGEPVSSLAFGSSKSQVKHRRFHHKHAKRVNNRFILDETLILAVGLESGKISIFDAVTLSCLFVLRDHKEKIRDLKFTRNDAFQLASVSNDGKIKIWDMFDDGNLYKTLDKHMDVVCSCDWSPTASLLCTVGAKRQAYIWNTKTFTVKFRLVGHMHDIVSCEFSKDGALLATASFDTKIFIWNPYNGQPMKQLYHLLPPPRPIFASGHNEAYVRAIKFNPTGTNLVSLCDDKKIRIWSLKTSKNPCIGESSECDAISCTYSSNGDFIFIGTREGNINVFKNPSKNVERLVDISRRIVNQLAERENIDKLNLPKDLENYLCYDDIQPIKKELKTDSNIKIPPLLTNQLFDTSFSSFNYTHNSNFLI